MQSPSRLSWFQKSIYSAFVFFGTLIVLSLVYAATTYYIDLPTTSSGSGLTATSWNSLVNYANKAVKQDTEILTVTGGKVGIGTVSPNRKLEVQGGLGADTAMIRSSYSADPTYYREFGRNNSTGLFEIRRSQGGVATTDFTIDVSGNIGIGTSSPSNTLTVSGGITANKFTTSTTWSAVTGDVNWTSALFCRRIGSFLQFKGYLSGAATSGWPIISLTLPANCWPSIGLQYISGNCHTGGTPTTSLCVAEITPGGALTVYNNNVFSYFSLVGTYPAD